MTPNAETPTVAPGAEVRGKVRNYRVEVVVKNADGTVKEKRVETVSKVVQ